MKSKENIVFLGMMGSGKTSIGILVSKKLKFNFFDIDKIIEKDLKMKIPEIFETKGENFFREIEEKTTLKILQKRRCVISLGGGGFLNKNIRNEVLSKSLSFWLKWDTKILLARIRNSTNRPIALKATDSELTALINKRSDLYSKALYKIKCNNLTKNQIVNNILEIYEN